MTNAELAILSLIAETPRHGYEIEQVIEARGMREWTEIGFSSIYYLLKKLEKEGLVESELVPTHGRGKARRIFQITESGREKLLASTLEALSQPQQCHPAILLGLANLPIVSAEQAKNALETYKTSIEGKLAEVSATLKSQRPLPSHVELLFGHSIAMLEAELVWVEKAIEKIE
ncbi:MAG: PadR family transcriptional regulator [Chloroflexi bacterium]|nr:PadR family transcriptional regulator [Chloroflexota bacterium]